MTANISRRGAGAFGHFAGRQLQKSSAVRQPFISGIGRNVGSGLLSACLVDKTWWLVRMHTIRCLFAECKMTDFHSIKFAALLARVGSLPQRLRPHWPSKAAALI